MTDTGVQEVFRAGKLAGFGKEIQKQPGGFLSTVTSCSTPGKLPANLEIQGSAAVWGSAQLKSHSFNETPPPKQGLT